MSYVEEENLNSSEDLEPVIIRSSDSSDDDVFSEILMNKHISSLSTQLDSEILNSSTSNLICVYPPNVVFPQTFPNKIMTQKIIISNSSSNETKFNASFAGEKLNSFSISSTSFVVPKGSTYSLILSFQPTEVCLYQISLILESLSSIVIPITAHCLPSPLEFPIKNSSFWELQRQLPFLINLFH